MSLTANLVDLLNDELRQAFLQSEWGLLWSEREPYLTIVFQMNLANPERILIEDSYLTHGSEAELLYEFSLVFYRTPASSVVPSTEAIHLVEVDDREGIPHGEVVAIIKYIKYLIIEARLKWEDFCRGLRDDFQIEWQEDHFRQHRDNLQATYRYNSSPYYFPRQSQS